MMLWLLLSIRNVRAENKIDPVKKVKAVIYAHDKQREVEEMATLIKSLKTGIEELEIKEDGEKIEGEIYAVANGVEIYLLGAIDKEKEKQRLEKEIENLERLIKGAEGKLNNKEFVERARKGGEHGKGETGTSSKGYSKFKRTIK